MRRKTIAFILPLTFQVFFYSCASDPKWDLRDEQIKRKEELRKVSYTIVRRLYAEDSKNTQWFELVSEINKYQTRRAEAERAHSDFYKSYKIYWGNKGDAYSIGDSSEGDCAACGLYFTDSFAKGNYAATHYNETVDELLKVDSDKIVIDGKLLAALDEVKSPNGDIQSLLDDRNSLLQKMSRHDEDMANAHNSVKYIIRCLELTLVFGFLGAILTGNGWVGLGVGIITLIVNLLD